MRLLNFLAIFCGVSLLSTSVHAQSSFALRLPTDNDYIFRGQPEKFYMYTYRNFEGKPSKPWQAGSYGYVRNLRRTDDGVIATKFHEGLDIRPLKRDRRGRPLDIVNAIASGDVVYVNRGASNYGNYVVVRHNWGSGDFFSLYAHLADVTCEVGQRLVSGSAIGRLGYTGDGINRERAHLHLELNMLLSTEFNDWYEHGSSNRHRNYNGINMAGMDLGKLYLALRSDRSLDLVDFLRAEPVYFKVTLPRNGDLDLVDRYPWLCPAPLKRPSPSWEFSFTATGLPVRVVPSNRTVSDATVTFTVPSQAPHRWKARKLIDGTGQTASLTKLGRRYLELLAPSSFLSTETLSNP